MAQERTYQSQVAPARPAGLPKATPETFGSTIGAAVAQLGQSIHQGEVRAYQIERQNTADSEAADFNRRFTEIRAAADTASVDARNNAAPGGAGHADRMVEWWRTQTVGLTDTITDDRVRRHAEGQLQDYAARIGSAEYAWQEGTRVKKVVSDQSEATAIAANRARRSTDYDAFRDELTLGRQAIEAMPGVPAEIREGLIEERERAVAIGFLTGVVDRSPKQIATLLNTGRFDDLVSPQDQERLRQGADVEIRRTEAAARAEAAAALAAKREELATRRAELDTGAGTPQDRAALAQDFQSIGDTSTAVEQAAKSVSDAAAIGWRSAKLVEMDARISTLQGKRNGGGLSTSEAAELTGLSDLRSQSASRLNGPGGALAQYLFATGKALPPLDPGNPDAMRQRAQLAAAAAAQYGRTVVEPITEAELPTFRDLMGQGATGKVRALEAIRRFGDARAIAGAARQMAGSDDGDFRIAATLSPQVARDVLLGPDRLKTQPGVLDAKAAARVLSTYYGSVLRQVGSGYDVDVLSAAQNFYVSRMVARGETTWDPGRFAEAIETVMGRRPAADGTMRGGVARTPQGLVVVPPDRTPEALMRTFARAGEPDYRAAAGGRAPRWGDGSPMTLGQVRGLLPTYRGNGRYGFRARDGRLIPNDKGGVYEVDIYQMRAR